MENQVNQRFKNWVDSERIKPTEISESLGVSVQTVYGYLNGKTTISLAHIEKIEKDFPSFNKTYVLLGHENDTIMKKMPVITQQLIDWIKNEIEEKQKIIEEQRQVIKTLSYVIENKSFNEVLEEANNVEAKQIKIFSRPLPQDFGLAG